MIKLKSLITESSRSIKWILGYIDAYDKNHYKVVYHEDQMDSHQKIWPGKISAHGKWRWDPKLPRDIHTYNEPLTDEDKESIWNIIDSVTSR